MDTEDYASDSDQSDEDYCPLKETAEVLSEEESGDESAPGSGDEGDAHAKQKKKRVSKQKKKQPETTASRKRRAGADTTTDDSAAKAGETPAVDEKEKSDDEDKSHADALWASFLGDTEPKTKAISQPVVKKQIVTETVEFAGEKIEIRKEVPVKTGSDLFAISSSRPDPVISKPVPANASVPLGLGATNGQKRSFGGAAKAGGLSSVLGQLGKKTKISVLEKSALDWKSFKSAEGIDEQLQTHNKGKDGYLERQDFLQRTDLRQFEIEKDLRQLKRSNR